MKPHTCSRVGPLRSASWEVPVLFIQLPCLDHPLCLTDKSMVVPVSQVQVHINCFCLGSLCSSVPAGVRGAERDNEGREAGGLLAGDRPMAGFRGELRPTDWGVGVLARLLPHLQEPHPAPTHHEHRLVLLFSSNCFSNWLIIAFLVQINFSLICFPLFSLPICFTM